MAVHLINQRFQLRDAVKLVTQGDTVIVTNDEAAAEAITAFADLSVTLALLEGTSIKSTEMSATETFKVISEIDWVRYTISEESVISWS